MDMDQDDQESSQNNSLKLRVAETCSLQDYIQGFAGYARVRRLLFLAEQCAGTEVALDALKMAQDELKENTLDTDLYKAVIQSINGYDGIEYQEDVEWVEKSESRFFVLQEDLEQRLVTAKSALDQRQIAALEKEYGDLLCRKGLFQEGMKHYLRIREYSKNSDDVLGMLEKATICAFYMKNYFAVINHCRKIDMIGKEYQDSPLVGRVRLVAVLTQVALGRFDMAAQLSSSVSHHAIVSSPDIVSPSSFALCVILCTIAFKSRNDLEALGSLQGFQTIINLAPQPAQDAFRAIRCARHGEVLLLLEELRQDVWLDSVLQPHMISLYAVIQDRCICEYSGAFSRISLPHMAEKFGLKDSDLENRLSKLILKGTLKAKLDAHAQELVLADASVANGAYQTAIQTAKNFLRDSSYLIIASQSIRAGVCKTTAIVPTESIDPEEHSKPATLEAGDFRTTASTQETR